MLKKYKLFSVKNPILKTPYKHCQRSLESAGSAAASGSPPALRRAVPRPVQWGRLPGALMGNKARLRHVIAASPPGSLIPRSQGCAGGGLAASCEGLQEGWGGGGRRRPSHAVFKGYCPWLFDHVCPGKRKITTRKSPLSYNTGKSVLCNRQMSAPSKVSVPATPAADVGRENSKKGNIRRL